MKLKILGLIAGTALLASLSTTASAHSDVDVFVGLDLGVPARTYYYDEYYYPERVYYRQTWYPHRHGYVPRHHAHAYAHDRHEWREERHDRGEWHHDNGRHRGHH